jgi:hypothetical protein
MAHRDFLPQSEKNGLLHPPNCACVKCAAGRESQTLSTELLDKVDEMLDATFIQMVQGNVMGGFQALGSGRPINEVRSGFLGNMANIFRMREMAAAYFAGDKKEEV